jgi:microcin C transport system substrate-binding protein
VKLPPAIASAAKQFIFKRPYVLALLLLTAAAPRTDILTLSTAPLPPAGYTSLPYANANAPKGGAFTVALFQAGDFDNLNPFILRGTPPDSIYMVWQPLFKTSDTDSVTSYAELASAVKITGNQVIFTLDPRARFSDNTPVLASDVVWTYNTLITQGSPVYASLYAGVASAAAPDAHTVVFTLKPGAGLDVPLNLSGIYVLPAHFWAHRNFADPLLDFPIGSGPYQVAKVSYGNYITYTHVKNWWAETIPSDNGFYNFDTYTEQFFQNSSVSLQAFKAGQDDARLELSSKLWASGYNFPAAHDGRVRLERVPSSLPVGIYGLQMNLRRPQFADVRTREALTLAFDYEWMNRVLFDDSYQREHSFFSNSRLASSGLPAPDELKLLNPFRGKIPEAVFTTPYRLPVTDGSGYNLPQLTQAMKLLLAAGWQVRNLQLVDAAGHQMQFEILLDDQAFERIVIAYAADLRKLGIDATVHTIDAATYQRRLNDYDFDMTENIYPETDFPGTEQADYWGCAGANTPGGNNWSGICNPAIDAMVSAELAAQTPAQKATAIHALDRVLLNSWIIIPWWSSTTERIAYWQRRVDKPEVPIQPGFDYTLWWHK